MHLETTSNASAAGLRIAIAASRYHAEIMDSLLNAAGEAFVNAGGRSEDMTIVRTPGAFELTAVCRALADTDSFDALVALGCVVTGETRHDRYICDSVTQGLTSITVETGLPIGFGLLTVETLQQAHDRAGGSHGNKGSEAMTAAIETAHTIRSIRIAGGVL